MRPFDLFFQHNSKIDGQTNRHTLLQFYISVMFLDLPNDIHEEKPSFLQLKKTHYGRTDGPTNGRTDRPSYRDAWTHLKSGLT